MTVAEWMRDLREDVTCEWDYQRRRYVAKRKATGEVLGVVIPDASDPTDARFASFIPLEQLQ